MEETKAFTTDDLKKFVVWMRKQEMELSRQMIFCSEHNFKLESTSIGQQRDVLMKVIHQCERQFDLGFVWDKSLD